MFLTWCCRFLIFLLEKIPYFENDLEYGILWRISDDFFLDGFRILIRDGFNFGQG